MLWKQFGFCRERQRGTTGHRVRYYFLVRPYVTEKLYVVTIAMVAYVLHAALYLYFVSVNDFLFPCFRARHVNPIGIAHESDQIGTNRAFEKIWWLRSSYHDFSGLICVLKVSVF